MSRNISITVTGKCSIDAHKAIVKKIEDTENKYALDKTSVSDLTAVKTVVTGTTPFKIYVFNLTITIGTGEYTAAFLEEAPNVETAESLQ